MDTERFDTLTRWLTETLNRRGVLRGMAGLGLLAALTGERAGAKKRKRLVFNQFGCVDVGQPCRGNDGNCCSGICDGRKPKKGKRDKSRCAGHDGTTCQAGQSGLGCGGAVVLPCTTSAGVAAGQCQRTTGNAAYCVGASVVATCSRDAECQTFFQNPDAACVVCSEVLTGTLCAIPNEAG
jgi:hypothetical protein